MPNTIFDIQLMNMNTFVGQPLQVSGGKVIVVNANTSRKTTLLNPDNAFASLANPVTPIRGKIRFAVSGTPLNTLVDIYGIAGDGRFFVVKGVQPANPTEILVSTNSRDQLAIVPYDINDFLPGVETDSGIILPAGSLVLPFPFVKVVTTAAARTINVGLLGTSAGLLNGVSTTAAATVTGILNGASPTIGSLIQEVSGTGTTAVLKPTVIAAATNISATLVSGSTTGAGFIGVPYFLPLS